MERVTALITAAGAGTADGQPPARWPRAPSSCSALIDIVVLRAVRACRARDLRAFDLGLRHPDPGHQGARRAGLLRRRRDLGGPRLLRAIARACRRGGSGSRSARCSSFFLIALLCWADAGNSTAVNLVSLMQQSFASSIPLVLGALSRLHVRAVRRDQHRDRGAVAGWRVHRRDRGQRHRLALARTDRRLARGRAARRCCSRSSRSPSWLTRSSSAWC